MKEHQIFQTMQYDSFKLKDTNRDIDEAHLKNLIAQMSLYNDMHLIPIVVNSDYEVVDGQHRLAAAKHLNEIVSYVIDDNYEEDKMIHLNRLQKSWTRDDYIKYWASKGVKDYVYFLDFCNKFNLSSGVALRWIARSYSMKDIKDGKFKFSSSETNIESLKCTLRLNDLLKSQNFKPVKIYNQIAWHDACKKVFKNDLIDVDQFFERIQSSPYKIKFSSGMVDYVKQLVDIYNYDRRKKRPKVQIVNTSCDIIL